jgi:hypothetical protein
MATTPAVLTAITCMLVAGHGDGQDTATFDDQPTTTSAGLAGGEEESHE